MASAAPSPQSVAPPSAPPAPAPAAPKKYGVAFRGAIGGSLTSNLTAPAAWIGLSLNPGDHGWGAELSLAWIGNRTEPLADHGVDYRRWPLLAGPYFRLASKSTHFDLEAGGALGWLRVEGDGFDRNFSHSSASVGAYASVRFEPHPGPLNPFVMVAPILWFGHATAASAFFGGQTHTDLPAIEVLLLAGVRLPS